MDTISGKMVPPIKANGTRMTQKDREITSGMMAVDSPGYGRKIICTGKEPTFGPMEGAMKENIITIKSMGTAPTNGLTEEFMRVSGKMANNTDKASLLFRMVQLEQASGITERGHIGSKMIMKRKIENKPKKTALRRLIEILILMA